MLIFLYFEALCSSSQIYHSISTKFLSKHFLHLSSWNGILEMQTNKEKKKTTKLQERDYSTLVMYLH